MKNVILISTLALAICSGCKTRNVHSKQIVPTKAPEQIFANQGEQEKYWAEQIFKNHYARQKFKKFSGSIRIIDKNHIQYDEEVILLDNSCIPLISIFSNGVLYPQIISDEDVGISNLEDQPFLTHSPKIKRFRFLLWSRMISNPTVYFFELQNNKATSKTTLEDFVKEAKLTFVYHGSILI